MTGYKYFRHLFQLVTVSYSVSSVPLAQRVREQNMSHTGPQRSQSFLLHVGSFGDDDRARAEAQPGCILHLAHWPVPPARL